jgi:O-antigen/teichoic acid export membrane protein
MIFLERLVPQRAEISFFSVAFNLTDKMLLLPNTLGQATSVTLMAQFGRDNSQLPSMAAVTLKHMLLLSTPLLLGMAALSPAVVPLFYGEAFRPAAVALALAATLAMPRSLLGPGYNYLQAIERQRMLLFWNFVCAGIDIGLDLTLIPRWKALGAVMASGIAQLFSVVGIWVIIISLEKVKAPWGAIVRILVSGAVMATGVTLVVRHFSPVLAILLGIPAGAVLYLGCIRMLGVLNAADRYRLRSIGQRLPARVRPALMKTVALMAGSESVTEL